VNQPVFFQAAIQDGHLHVAPLGTPYDTASPVWVDVGPAPDWAVPPAMAPRPETRSDPGGPAGRGPGLAGGGRMNTPRTGDRYRDRGIRITVGEVDPGGRWAMIHCIVTHHYGTSKPFDHSWDKQQPTPGGGFPDSWTRVEEEDGT
jgi:hypothetical protein